MMPGTQLGNVAGGAPFTAVGRSEEAACLGKKIMNSILDQ